MFLQPKDRIRIRRSRRRRRACLTSPGGLHTAVAMPQRIDTPGDVADSVALRHRSHRTGIASQCTTMILRDIARNSAKANG
jgi:hypothetical protein